MRLQHYPSTKEEPTLCASTRESLTFYGQKYSIKKAHIFLYIVLCIILIILFYIISFLLFFIVSKIIRKILLSLHTTLCRCSVTKSCPTLYSSMDCSTPSYSTLHSLPEFAQIHVLWVVMLSSHLILCHPLFLLLSVFPSIRVFSSEWAFCIRWPKYWSSTSASVLLMNIQGWFPSGLPDLLSLLSKGHSRVQHHNLKESALQCPSFFTVQLLHLYMTTGKTTALTVQTFVGHVMSLLFNMLSRFAVPFLQKSKCFVCLFLISWLQSPPTVILKPKKIKSFTASLFPLVMLRKMVVHIVSQKKH